jgi:hypothetical protein
VSAPVGSSCCPTVARLQVGNHASRSAGAPSPGASQRNPPLRSERRTHVRWCRERITEHAGSWASCLLDRMCGVRHHDARCQRPGQSRLGHTACHGLGDRLDSGRPREPGRTCRRPAVVAQPVGACRRIRLQPSGAWVRGSLGVLLHRRTATARLKLDASGVRGQVPQRRRFIRRSLRATMVGSSTCHS